MLYHDGSHNQLMNVCQNKLKKQWINLHPKEDEDLQQFSNAYKQIFNDKPSRTFYWSGMGYTHGT